jgi:hypothetical protein
MCPVVCSCRAAIARLDFSALDREVVADQVNKQSQDREVGVVPCARHTYGEWLLHVSTFATTRVALPTEIEPRLIT